MLEDLDKIEIKDSLDILREMQNDLEKLDEKKAVGYVDWNYLNGRLQDMYDSLVRKMNNFEIYTNEQIYLTYMKKAEGEEKIEIKERGAIMDVGKLYIVFLKYMPDIKNDESRYVPIKFEDVIKINVVK